MNQAAVIRMLCNMIAIIYSIYISIALYETVDSVINVDATQHLKRPMFRADHTDLRDIIFHRIDFYYDNQNEEEEDRMYEHAIPPTEDRFLKEGFEIQSPFQVCYVNSYVVHDSNSTYFDYTKESEYDIEHMYNEFAELNKMYIVFDDIHMVFAIKHQQCIKYPHIYTNDEL